VQLGHHRIQLIGSDIFEHAVRQDEVEGAGCEWHVPGIEHVQNMRGTAKPMPFQIGGGHAHGPGIDVHSGQSRAQCGQNDGRTAGIAAEFQHIPGGGRELVSLQQRAQMRPFIIRIASDPRTGRFHSRSARGRLEGAMGR